MLCPAGATKCGGIRSRHHLPILLPAVYPEEFVCLHNYQALPECGDPRLGEGANEKYQVRSWRRRRRRERERERGGGSKRRSYRRRGEGGSEGGRER